MLWDANPEEGLEREQVSPVNFMDWRGLPVLEDAAAWWRPEMNLVDGAGEPMRVPAVEASENLFALLGVEPLLGDGFQRDSTLHGSEPEAVISHRLWRSRFGGDPAVLGRSVRLNGFAYTITGVMPMGGEAADSPSADDRWSGVAVTMFVPNDALAETR